MGFSQADWQELQRLQGKPGKIRFGPRSSRPPPIQIRFLPQLEKSKRPPDEMGYEKYQLRLW